MSQRSPTSGDLAGSEALLRALVDHAPGFAAVLDDQARLVFIGGSIGRGSGWSEEELLGRSVLEFVHPDDVAAVGEMLHARSEAPEAGQAVEARVRRRDGSYAWVEAVANNLLDDPDVRGIVVNAHDVTERKRAEALFRAAFEASGVGMALGDADGRYIEVNPSMNRMLGYEDDELRGRSFREITHPDDVEADEALSAELLAGLRDSYSLDKRYLRKDGSVAWGRLAVFMLRVPEQGAVSLALVEDITERRATEQALARANERYRTLVETIPAVSYVWEFGTPPAETALYYTSPQIEMLLGYTPEEWGADPDFWISRLHPDDRDAVLEAADIAERTGAPYRMECRYLATDGRVVWVQDEAVMIARRDDGSPWLYQGVMMDITARKGVEEELRSTSAYLRAIVDSSPVAIVSMDLDGTVRSWNEGAERIFGWTEEEAVGRFLPHVGPEHRAEFEALRDRLLERSSSHERVEIRRRRKDGSPVDLAQSYAPLRDALGRVTGMVAIQEDVTEQERARAQAAELEERYRTLVEQIPAVTFVDEIVTVGERVEFTTVYVSPQVETMLGYDRDRYAAERMWATILHPLDEEPILRAAADHVERREPIDTEYRLAAADGRIVWVREQSMPLPQRGGRMFWQGVLYDITATKETELMLRNSEAELQRSLDVLRRTDEERRDLLAHLMAAENLERGRMAEGIEDDSLQHMTAVGLRLESLRRRLTDPEHVGAVDQLGETVEQALSRLRSVLVELRPRSLEQDGLGQALRQFARVAARDRDVRVDVEDRLGSQPDLEVRSLAYRIAQEAISNAVSWSRGTRVDVLVEERDGGVSIRVEDDGVGFEAEALDPATAIGVTSMTERAEVAGGWLRIGPGAGGGAVVECWLPGGVLGRSVDSAV